MFKLRLKIQEIEELLPEFLQDVYLGLCPAEGFIWIFLFWMVWRI